MPGSRRWPSTPGATSSRPGAGIRASPSPAADTLAESAEAHSDLEKQLEEGFNHELFEMAMNCVKNRVQPATWKAFHLTAIEGLSGAAAAAKLQIPVGNVFVAKHRVQKMLQEEVLLLKNEPN